MMGGMGERIYSMHCAGRTVPEIAKKVNAPEEAVREMIVARWAELKRDAEIESMVKGRWVR